MLKNESCQNCVSTIPLCRGGRDEATGENGIEIGRRNHPYAPARLLATRTDTRHASHASSSPGWADPTRLPDDPTHVPNPDEKDVIMASACPVGKPCQRPVSDMSAQWDPPPTSSDVSRVEPSCVGAEPRREPRDTILCSGVYVQPDLRLNLGRSSGQNCFDQILAV